VNLPEDDRIAPPGRGDDGLPEIAEPPKAADDDGEHALRSLRDDVEALIEDGKTYLETELVYQKTRAAFVADGAKGAVIYGALAAAFGSLALVGLTVGLIIALTPLLTAWGASAVVVALLVLAAWIALRAASARWNRLMQAIESDTRERP
jgi:Flp pilus assembly protein TadB